MKSLTDIIREGKEVAIQDDDRSSLNENVSKSDREMAAKEIASAVREGGGIEDMDNDDVKEMIGMFLEDMPGAESADEYDIKAIHKLVQQYLYQ